MSLDIETLKKEAIPGETVLVGCSGKEVIYYGLTQRLLIARDPLKHHVDEYGNYDPSQFKIKKETPKLYEWAFQIENEKWFIYGSIMTERDADKLSREASYTAKKKLREIVID